MPALAPKPFAEGEKLKAIKDLPDWAQKGFAGMETLNRIQSRVSYCLSLIRQEGCFLGAKEYGAGWSPTHLHGLQ